MALSEIIHVRLPRLLKKELNADGRTLKESGRLHPIKQPLELNMIPPSSASITIPESDPDVRMHDFIELYNQHGSCGIFRVVNIRPTYRKNRQLDLKHAIDVLNDSVHPGSPPGDETFSGTAKSFLTEILGAQEQKIGDAPYWQLGQCDDTSYWHKKIAYDNVLECFTELAQKHEDFMFTFDFSTFPWTVNFIRRDDTVLTEFRLNRNIESCQVEIDDSDMCTRLYLSVTTKETVVEEGQEAGEKTTQTFSTYNDTEAQTIWGIIEKTAGVETDEVPDVAAWVQDYFKRHNAPSIAITVEGEDLKELTGENIDEAHLGRICRTALPQYDTLFLERIVTVKYPDALRQPSRIVASMANKRLTAENAIAAVRKEAERASGNSVYAGRYAANTATEVERQKIRLNLEVTKTDERFSIFATEEEWSELKETYLLTHSSYFALTAREIETKVSRTEYNELDEAVVRYATQTEQNSQNISLIATAEDLEDAKQSRKSLFQISADAISGEVSRATGEEASIKLTVAGLTSRVADTEGNVSTLTQTASSLDSRLTSAEGNISSVTQTANGLSTRLATAEGDISTLEQTASSLQSQITDNAGNISTLTQTANSFGTRLANAEGNISTVTQTANKISLVVNTESDTINAASIVAAINNSGSTVQITAGHIILDGQTVADSLSSDEVFVDEIYVGDMTANSVTTGSLIIDTGHGQIDVLDMEDRLEDVETTIDTAVVSIGPATASGGQITIPWTKADGTAGTPVNFNIADTQFYQDGVAAAYNQGLIDGGSEVPDVTLAALYADEDSTHAIAVGPTGRVLFVPMKYRLSTDESAVWWDSRISVDASLAYEAGQNSVSIEPANSWVNGKFAVSTDAPIPQTYEVSLPTFSAATDFSFDSQHRIKAYFYTPSVSNPLATATIDASEVYVEGQNAVSITGPAWSQPATNAQATFSTNAPTPNTKQLGLYLTQTGLTVQLRSDSASGDIRAYTSVESPKLYHTDVAPDGTESGPYEWTSTINGNQVPGYTIKIKAANSGWSGTERSITIPGAAALQALYADEDENHPIGIGPTGKMLFVPMKYRLSSDSEASWWSSRISVDASLAYEAGEDGVVLADWSNTNVSEATTSQIAYLGKRVSSTTADVAVGVTLSNGKSYSRWITGLDISDAYNAGRNSYGKSVTLRYVGTVDGVYTWTTSTYVSGLTVNNRYTVHFDA